MRCFIPEYESDAELHTADDALHRMSLGGIAESVVQLP